ncbi:hypothetical protein CH330_09375 [candidate division WOR-3 bacterium JGI_Cruoil_03_51_56]|uniref:Uncharacterized protein n=1 Tax=candidate division WOR-3 bacterium JGI_Cruoil_03_51_56 TaxID=1973747 RepID=A0A235BPF2_UNCW3|nr:MAG: hypothetical protein CH330_09375 [candidate division WOR-3 bacterium JGI_Cruoil_03_51_56]
MSEKVTEVACDSAIRSDMVWYSLRGYLTWVLVILISLVAVGFVRKSEIVTRWESLDSSRALTFEEWRTRQVGVKRWKVVLQRA